MIRNLIKKLLSFNFILPISKGNRFIFIYHDVSDVNNAFYSKHYSTTPESFRNQIAFLQKHFELVSLDAIVASNLSKSKNYAAIVFDDGFKTIKTECAPILKAKNIPFAIFVNKSAILHNRLWLSDLELGNNNLKYQLLSLLAINETEQLIELLKKNRNFNNNIEKYTSMSSSDGLSVYLNETDIIELHANGVIIGSHTVNHPVLSYCDDLVQQKEIEENKQYLDDLLRQNTEHFAFPFGKKDHFSAKTIQLLKNAGHKYFYSSNPIGFRNEIHANASIPRIGLLNDNEAQLMFYINRQFLKSISL